MLFHVPDLSAQGIQDGQVASLGGREQHGMSVLGHLYGNHRIDLVAIQSPAGDSLMCFEIKHPDLGSAIFMRTFAALVHGNKQAAQSLVNGANLHAAGTPAAIGRC